MTDRFAEAFDRFRRMDQDAAHQAGSLLFVGSSTIRLWPDLPDKFPSLEAPSIIQRGFGGGHLQDVVVEAETLFGPHRPAAIILYAGENDLAAGASPGTVIDRFLTLRTRLTELGQGQVPLVVIGNKPSPDRWERWPAMQETNRRLIALADQDVLLTYVDLPKLLFTAEHLPDPDLFLADGLHLNLLGYSRLEAALETTLQRILHN